jgi:hypothetical protein
VTTGSVINICSARFFVLRNSGNKLLPNIYSDERLSKANYKKKLCFFLYIKIVRKFFILPAKVLNNIIDQVHVN